LFLLFAKESTALWLEVSFYLLVGMIIAGLLHTFLEERFIRYHLGEGGGLIIKATILDIPLPVCSCGVIPLFSPLRKESIALVYYLFNLCSYHRY